MTSGLASAVFKDRLAVREGGGHQQVLGARDGDLVEDDVRASEAAPGRGPGFEVAVLLRDDGTHGLQAADVEVDGTAADGASARHGDAGDACAGDERAEDEGAGAHGLHDLVLGDRIGEDGAADVRPMLGASVAEFDLGPHADEQLALGFDVLHLGDVLQDDFVLGEDGGGHAGERGVLRARDFDRAEKRVAAAYYKLVHLLSLRKVGPVSRS